MKKILFSLLTLLITLSFVTINQVSAQNPTLINSSGNLDLVKENSGLPGSSGGNFLPEAIGRIIGFFLSFLGILAVILFLYAGFLWMTAGGDSGKVDKAKSYMKNAVIGIVIILAAYIITDFVIREIGNAIGV